MTLSCYGIGFDLNGRLLDVAGSNPSVFISAEGCDRGGNRDVRSLIESYPKHVRL